MQLEANFFSAQPHLPPARGAHTPADASNVTGKALYQSRATQKSGFSFKSQGLTDAFLLVNSNVNIVAYTRSCIARQNTLQKGNSFIYCKGFSFL
jgi:hypothetical protein